MKLEVHHIQPEAKGGSDQFDNAIVLCFDCHADAGAYNPEHPRGTRITPEELRRARDEWYQTVKDGNIEARPAIEAFHCRYVIGKNFDHLREIASSDLQRFPISEPLLINTPALRFLRSVIQSHSEEYRWAQVYGDVYETREDYLRAHADSDLRPTSHEGGFQYFTFERLLSTQELQARVAPEDAVTRLLLESEIPARQIARALAYEDACAGGFPEIYRTRPLWGVFLAITNVSEFYLTLTSVEGESFGAGLRDFRPMHSLGEADTTVIPLPRSPLAPGATVVVPVTTVLGPLDHFSYRSGFTQTQELGHAHWQSFTHVTAPEERTLASFAWGPAFSPQRIHFIYDGFAQTQSVHELNVDNVYEIDRHWGMGSCPHAFVIDRNDEVTYLGEVLATGSRRLVRETIQVPYDAVAVVIAELEEEITFLQSARAGTDVLHASHFLHQGEYIVLKPTASELILEGLYLPLKTASGERARQPFRRNELVSNFRAALAGSTSQPASPTP